MSGGDLRIRKAQIEDVPIIFEMILQLAAYEKKIDEVEATPELLTMMFFGEVPQAHCILAEAGEKAVGFAVYFFTYSTFVARRGIYLEDLFVIESMRGKGFGERMLRYVAQIAIKQHCARFEWTVLDWNQNAISFYKKMGARLLEDWRVCRVSGTALQTLAKGKMKD